MTAEEPKREPAAEAPAPEVDKERQRAEPRPIPVGRAESITGGAGPPRDHGRRRS